MLNLGTGLTKLGRSSPMSEMVLFIKACYVPILIAIPKSIIFNWPLTRTKFDGFISV